MPKLDITTEEIQTPQHRRVCRMRFNGLISAPTIDEFRAALDSGLEKNTDLLVDFEGISYINSSGLGQLVRSSEEFEARSLHLFLINTGDDIKSLAEMLGMHEVLHMADDIDTALDALDKDLDIRTAPVPTQEEPHPTKKPAEKPEPRLPQARIVLGFSTDNHFTDFLQKALSGTPNPALVASSRADFARIMAREKVDVVLLDSDLPDYDEICTMLKTDTENGLISVITVFASPDDDRRGHHFRVREDDFVVEPCEVREVLALIEREYLRCQEEGLLFRQEANLYIPGENTDIVQATETLKVMLNAVEMQEQTRDAFLYAIREGIDNGRRHGNGGNPNLPIEATYILDREKVSVRIKDQGSGFDYSRFLDHANAITPVEQARKQHENGKHGGLGINLMLRCCDEVAYEEPGNILTLTRYL